MISEHDPLRMEAVAGRMSAHPVPLSVTDIDSVLASPRNEDPELTQLEGRAGRLLSPRVVGTE